MAKPRGSIASLEEATDHSLSLASARVEGATGPSPRGRPRADVSLEEGVAGGEDARGESHDIDCTFRYCTEAVAELTNMQSLDEDAIRRRLQEADGGALGNSIGVVVSELSTDCKIAKVHIHANKPNMVYSLLEPMCKDGVLYKEKAEDMFEQVDRSKKPRQMLMK